MSNVNIDLSPALIILPTTTGEKIREQPETAVGQVGADIYDSFMHAAESPTAIIAAVLMLGGFIIATLIKASKGPVTEADKKIAGTIANDKIMRHVANETFRRKPGF